MAQTIAPSECVVEIGDLHKQYRLGAETIQALGGVDLRIERGAFVAIMGASGSGKTTLMHLVGGLDLPDRGFVRVAGQDLTGMADTPRTIFRRHHIGVVFQSYNLLPSISALENVMLPLLVDGQSAAQSRARAIEQLELVHLAHRHNHRPTALSGGEQQRVAIARALIGKPALILADEPTGNLDPVASLQIWQLLRRLADQQNTTVLMVTHEAIAAAHADCVHVLKAGRIAGLIESRGSGDAALVAARYAQLAD
jgi:putative ABC transport system ATP-binding protein